MCSLCLRGARASRSRPVPFPTSTPSLTFHGDAPAFIYVPLLSSKEFLVDEELIQELDRPFFPQKIVFKKLFSATTLLTKVVPPV